MKNKWAYLWMNLSFIFSFLFYFASATVCNELGLTFETGVVLGASSQMGILCGIIGIFFMFIIIGNNYKSNKKENKKWKTKLKITKLNFI